MSGERFTTLAPGLPVPTAQTTITQQPTRTAASSRGQVITNINTWTVVGIGAFIAVVTAAGVYYLRRATAGPTRPKRDIRRPPAGTTINIALPPSASSSQPSTTDTTASSSSSSSSPSKPTISRFIPGGAAPSSSSTSEAAPSTPLRSSARTTASGLSSSSPSTPFPVFPSSSSVSDDELMRLLNLSIASLQGGHNDESLEQQIRQQLSASLSSLLSRPLPVRSFYAQWLLAVSTHRITHCDSEDEFDNEMRKQEQDMAIAWRLLRQQDDADSGAARDEEKSRELDLIRIQVGQNLKLPALLAPVFDRMMQRKGRRSEEEAIVLFTIAPLLGRWKEVRELGAELISRMGSLSQFHLAPIDYSILYDLALASTSPPAPLPTPPLSSLTWTQYRIVVQRIRLRDVQCADADAVSQLREEFGGGGAEDADVQWKNVNLQEGSRVIRCGAIVQASSFSTVPMTLVGPGDGRSIHCRGYADLQADCIVRQWEGYRLTCEAADEEMEEVEEERGQDGSASVLVDDMEGRRLRVKPDVERQWTGEYTMTQEKSDPDGPGHFARIHVIFDLELTLKSLPL